MKNNFYCFFILYYKDVKSKILFTNSSSSIFVTSNGMTSLWESKYIFILLTRGAS